MNRFTLPLAALAALTLALPACSSSSEDDTPAPSPAPAELFGEYSSLSPSASLASLSFDGASYRFRPRGCEARSCEESGSYAFDAKRREIDLVADTGRAYTLPFEVTATRTARRIAGSSEAPDRVIEVAESAANLIDKPQTQLIDGPSMLIGTNLEMGGQGYTLIEPNVCFQGVGTSWSNDGQDAAMKEAWKEAWDACWKSGNGNESCKRKEDKDGKMVPISCSPGRLTGWTCVANACKSAGMSD